MIQYLDENDIKKIFKPNYYKNIPVRYIKGINVTYANYSYKEYSKEELLSVLGKDSDRFINLNNFYDKQSEIEELEILIDFELLSFEVNQSINQLIEEI